MKASGDKEAVEKEVKAIMFVPYTEGSELAKRLRDAENTLQEMTGYKMKIVERSGLKLEEMLHKADPWQGQDCGRARCLLCLTKQRTGKFYETWCVTCLDKDTEQAEIQAEGDKTKLKLLTDRIRVHKYIGETCWSKFERSWEHLNDLENQSIKSHLLKHAVEMHGQEELNTLKFGMKVIRYAKTSFERQSHESVEIQENRHHHLLNSRSEFNRCALPSAN